MIRSVVREHDWPPHIVGGLFVDAVDYEGLEFWYEDCVEMNKKMEESKSKKK